MDCGLSTTGYSSEAAAICPLRHAEGLADNSGSAAMMDVRLASVSVCKQSVLLYLDFTWEGEAQQLKSGLICNFWRKPLKGKAFSDQVFFRL